MAKHAAGRRPAFLMTTAACDPTGRPYGTAWLYVYEDEIAGHPEPRRRAARAVAEAKHRRIVDEAERTPEEAAALPLIVRVLHTVEK